MARELWAKVHTEILGDPKLLCRPEGERFLWLALILLAKEKAETDGILRGYTPALLTQVLALRMKPAAVEIALTYFASVGMVALGDGTIELLNFVTRQGRSDTREAQRERARKYRERHGSVTRDERVSNEPVTRDARSLRHAEEEEEEEEEKNKKNTDDAAASPAPSPVPLALALEPDPPPANDDDAVIAKLEADWPADLIARLKIAVSSSRASGRMSSGPWRGFLSRAAQFDKPRREAAAQLYLDRAHGPDGKGEAYLVGMMRNSAGSDAPPRGGPASVRIDPSAHTIPGRKFL